jgi:hypothetical protein
MSGFRAGRGECQAFEPDAGNVRLESLTYLIAAARICPKITNFIQ